MNISFYRVFRLIYRRIFFLQIILGFVMVSGFIFFLSPPARAVESLPGSTWGIVTHSFNGLTGSGAMGFVNQGVDWLTLPGGIKFNTYVEYRYRHRTKQNEFYDAEGPALGLEFKKSFLKLGADYYWEKFPNWPGGAQRSSNREVYLTGYYSWDIQKTGKLNLSGIAGLPGSTWFDLTYDINGLTGSGAMGFVNQGIDWFRLPGGVTFNTYAEYRYRSRTKQNQFYNAEGPALGLELKKSVFRLGMDYYWEKFPELEGHSNYFEAYLTWYVDWDLKPVMKDSPL